MRPQVFDDEFMKPAVLYSVQRVDLRLICALGVVCLSLLFSPAALAINASPEAIELQQPDGTQIRLFPKGDEFLHWFEDENRYAVVREKGQYVYATPAVDGRLAPSGWLVGRVNPAVVGIQQGLKPSREAQRAARINALPPQLRQSASASLGPVSDLPSRVKAAGTVKNLVILCKFADHDSTKIRPRADYVTIFNTVGGDATLAPTGSVKDYFTEVSYGTVNLQSTVVAWVTLPRTEAFYGNGNDGTGATYPANAQGMVEDALKLVDPLVDFGDFDSDNDGYIDAITIIHSGYAAETGGGSGNWIWSHKWSLWALPGGKWTSADKNANGVSVKVYDYHTEAALWSTSGKEITRIGVICHETGHFFGLPDLYDTDNSSEGIGSYCLMANSWGFDFTQRHPPHFSAWCKIQLGFVTPQVITAGNYSAPRAETNKKIFKIKSGYGANEYLLIENRQPYGFQSDMPKGGLAIWHIDDSKEANDEEGYPGQTGWPQNGKHYRVALLQADGRFDMEHGTNRGDSTDLYSKPNSITPSTVPNTNRYEGGIVGTTNHSIINISDPAPTMTFTLSAGGGGNKPNLKPYKPGTWSDKIVVSKTTGTTTDSATLRPADTLYVDWAVFNEGTVDINKEFKSKLYVDGVLKATFLSPPPTRSNRFRKKLDYKLGSLAAGTHTLKIVVDATGVIAESNEGDNEYTKTITVGSSTSQVNLKPYKPEGWSAPIVISKTTGTFTDSLVFRKTDTLYVDWAVANLGSGSTTADFQVKLVVDGVLKAWGTIPAPMAGMYYNYWYDYNIGTLTTGNHNIRIVADYLNAIPETNETDNVYTRTITVVD